MVITKTEVDTCERMTSIRFFNSLVKFAECVHSPVTPRREIRQLQCQLIRVTICFTNSAPVNVTRC